ncbi:MAG: hypothetical protein QOI63_1437 [Thermoplasmata archaeon]|jgi:hypothetical protein|nr:hypothetical protein [Thermoplasmata archaeon]
MLGFLFKVTAGTVKLGVKYIIVPALLSVAITLAAEAIAEGIRSHTPEPPQPNGAAHRRRAPSKVRAAHA